MEEFKFYPNPFNNGLNLRYYSDQKRTVRLNAFDMLGKLYFSKEIDLEKGYNDLYLPESEELGSGVYMINIQGLDREVNSKIIKID